MLLIKIESCPSESSIESTSKPSSLQNFIYHPGRGPRTASESLIPDTRRNRTIDILLVFLPSGKVKHHPEPLVLKTLNSVYDNPARIYACSVLATFHLKQILVRCVFPGNRAGPMGELVTEITERYDSS